jgi:eukaryotic-like serine/threonine-protein kinase
MGPRTGIEPAGQRSLALRARSAVCSGVAIDVGSRIRDYEIIARLKSGGMATMFLARRAGVAGFSRHVAIKVVHPHLAEDQGFIRMFIDEALLSARIQHPNVVHVEELGEDKGTYFLAMEYVHGSALSTLLGSLARLERRLSPEVAVWIAMGLAQGLHAAHELKAEDGSSLGVVHRDVSPQNVLLSMTGHVKLIDFGIAKAASSSGKKTETGSLKGKLRYMAPEQAHGRNVDRRTDIYALGIVLWEMLTMHRMFGTGNDLSIIDEVRNPKVVPPSALAADVPPALDRAIMAALAPDAAQRPATALDFRRMLGEALPAAHSVDAGQVSEILEAVLGERLEAKRKELPESLTGLSVSSSAKPIPEERSMKRGNALRTMTLSAPGAQYHADQEVSQDGPNPFQESSRRGSFTGPPAMTSPNATPTMAPPPGRDRMIAIVFGAIALVAVGVMAGVLLSNRGGDVAPPAAEVAVVPPPVATPPATTTPITDTVAVTPEVPDEEVGADDAIEGDTPRQPTKRRGRRPSRDPQGERPASLVDGVPIYDDDGFGD